MLRHRRFPLVILTTVYIQIVYALQVDTVPTISRSYRYQSVSESFYLVFSTCTLDAHLVGHVTEYCKQFVCELYALYAHFGLPVLPLSTSFLETGFSQAVWGPSVHHCKGISGKESRFSETPPPHAANN
jgi:hypothetical protein